MVARPPHAGGDLGKREITPLPPPRRMARAMASRRWMAGHSQELVRFEGIVSTSERSLTVIDVDRGQGDGFGESDRWHREGVRWVRAIVIGLPNEVIRCFLPSLPLPRGGRSGG